MAYSVIFEPRSSPPAAHEIHLPGEPTGDEGKIIPADWVYDQSTGTITHYNESFANLQAARRAAGLPYTPMPNQGDVGAVYVGNYSGRSQGLNNPAAEDRMGIGPIPSGGYLVGPIGTQATGTGHHLPEAMRLTPMPGNEMHGRAGFLIHGGNLRGRNNSEGCIVAPPDVRRAIGESDDNRLWSVPGWIGKGL
jgi:hypothetical protein